MFDLIPWKEKIAAGATILFTIILAVYKHWLRSKPEVMQGNMLERAFVTARQPGYWWFLILGFLFILLLVALSLHLLQRDARSAVTLACTIINLILLVVLVLVFWDPILTTFFVLVFAGGLTMAAMS